MYHLSVERCPDGVDEPAVRIEEEVERFCEIVTDELFKGKKKPIRKATCETRFDRVGDLETRDTTTSPEMFPSLKRDALRESVSEKTAHSSENVRLTKFLQSTSMKDRLREESDRKPRRVRRRETGEIRETDHFWSIESPKFATDRSGKITYDGYEVVRSIGNEELHVVIGATGERSEIVPARITVMLLV
jgi:hypothetical protein